MPDDADWPDLDRPAVDPASSPVAGDPHGRSRQSRTGEPGRDEGRRPSGVECVARHGDDGAVVRAPGRRRSRERQAARIAGAARHQLPPRRARPRVPDESAAVRRAAVVPVAHEGSRSASTSRRDRSGSVRPPRCSRRAVRRYVDAHFGARERSRFIALIGDAELDEGNVWEAIADPVTAGLGDVMWIVDFNRQSLDRVIPGVRIEQWTAQFSAAGWHVVEVKYGRRLRAAFDRPGGAALRDWLDVMPNEQYQSVFGLPAGGSASPVPRRRARSEVVEVLARRTTTSSAWRSSPISAATTWLRCWTPSPSATRRPSGRASSSPTRSRASACPSPVIRATTPLCSTTGQVDALRAVDGTDAATPSGTGSTPGASEGGCVACAQAALRKPHARRRPSRCRSRPAWGSSPLARRRRRSPSGGSSVDLARDDGPASVPRDAPHPTSPRRRISAGSSTASACTRPRIGATVERGPGAEVGGGPDRPAPRAGHQRDEPVHDARCAGPVRRAERPAAAADRHGLRPVRAAGTRRLRARRVLRRPVHRRGHSVGRDAGSGGRRAPVDDHGVRRHRAARAS